MVSQPWKASGVDEDDPIDRNVAGNVANTQHPRTESESSGASVLTNWLPWASDPQTSSSNAPPATFNRGVGRSRPLIVTVCDVAWGKYWKAWEEFNLGSHNRYVLEVTFYRIPPDCRDSKGIELLGSIIWYRSKATIKKISVGGYAEASSSRPYARELPQEIIEMIIADVLLDTPTLKACSATCRSWYIATLPHLHHTLTLHQWTSDPVR